MERVEVVGNCTVEMVMAMKEAKGRRWKMEVEGERETMLKGGERGKRKLDKKTDGSREHGRPTTSPNDHCSQSTKQT
jgi:hypothetical protein